MTAKRSAKAKIQRRFVEGESRSTSPRARTVRPESVNVDERTLTAIAATGTPRTICIYVDELDAYIDVEEVIDIAGMDLSRVETGMQFLDNHYSWDLDSVLGVVTEARLEDVTGVGDAIVVDVQLSSREELDPLIQDLADGILGCISCSYSIDESTLEMREGELPLLTVTQSTLLEASLVSVPADPNAQVRSKGKPMTTRKPSTRSVASSKRSTAASRVRKRAEDAPVDQLDEAAIEAIVEAAVEEAVEAAVEIAVEAAVDEIVEELGGDAAGETAERAKRSTRSDDDDEDDKGDRGKRADDEDEDNPVRSMVRSMLAKRGMLGKRSAQQQGKNADLTNLRSMATKYDVAAEFDDMKSTGASHSELRSFVLAATAARSGTGPTHDGRRAGQRSNSNSQLLSWGETNIGKRAAERASKR